MPNLFDAKKKAAYAIVAETMGYDATWTPQGDTVQQTARVLFNDPTKTAKIKNIEYSPIEKAVDEVKTLIQSKSKLKKGEVGVFSDGNLIIVSETLARDFIKIHLPQLLTTYQVFGAEKLRNYKIIASVAKLNFALKSGIDFLEGDASLEIEG